MMPRYRCHGVLAPDETTDSERQEAEPPKPENVGSYEALRYDR